MGAFGSPPRTRFLVVVLVSGAWLGLASAQDEPRAGKEANPRLHLPLTGTAQDLQAATRIGPNLEKCVQFEAAGLRIRLPAGFPGERPPTGLSVPVSIKGDFAVTVSFEILQEPEGAAAGKRGTKLTLSALLDTSEFHLARLARRSNVDEGTQFSTWTKSGKKGPFAAFATTAKSGRLRLVRTGAAIFYYVAEGDAAEFNLLDQRPFSGADVKEIHIAGSTGGPEATLDARFRDLRLGADVLPEDSRALSARRTWGRLELLSLVIALAAVFATASWVYVRRRRRDATAAPAVEREQAAPAANESKAETARTTTLIRCTGCGKELRTRTELAGKHLKCPHCGAIVK
jgi:DNA-directed RNA polymerase subunit RPC12/RpoP